MINVLFVTYWNQALDSSLRELGVDSSWTSGDIWRLHLNTYDVIYYARFGYPLLSADLNILSQKLRDSQIKIICAFHMPLLIKYPRRLIDYLRNFLLPFKLPILAVVDAFHSLNIFDHTQLMRLSFKSYHIPIGVDCDKFKLGNKYRQFTIRFAGGPRYQKGVDYLLKIVPEVLTRCPNTRFILSGSGYLPQYYLALERKFKGNVVAYTTSLPLDKHIELYSKSHLLLFPSQWESGGPPHVVLEGLAAGMPVVAFDIPGMEILTKSHAGILVRPFDVDGIVRGVQKIYEAWTRGDYPEQSIKARETALMYDWKILAPLYVRMFKEIAT